MSNTDTADDLTNGTDTTTDRGPRGDPDGDEITPVSELGDAIDPSDLWDTDVDALGTYNVQRHRNGDITVLQLSSFGDGYQVLAFEVTAGGELLAVDEVGFAPDASHAITKCEVWVEQNPKGILGGAPDDEDDDGLFGGLFS